MKHTSLLILSLCLLSSAFAQSRIGLFLGVADYQGDLTDKILQNPRGAGGITYTYNFSPRLGVRAGLTLAKIAGADSLSDDPVLRARNLSFQTMIEEFSLLGQFTTFDMDVKKWSPYLFAGLAVYHYNPYAYDVNGYRVKLQPLGTEGQGLPGYAANKYPLTQLALPFGGGVKFNLSNRLQLGAEVGLRKLFTDYLDDLSGNYADGADLLAGNGQQAFDLSYRGDEIAGGNPAYPAKGTQRGGAKYKDYYYFAGLHLTMALGDGSGGRKSSLDCPKVF